MQGKSFRLKSATLGITSEQGERIPVTIPSGAVIKVVRDPHDGNRLLDVVWDGKPVMMFTQDVRERGEQV